MCACAGVESPVPNIGRQTVGGALVVDQAQQLVLDIGLAEHGDLLGRNAPGRGSPPAVPPPSRSHHGPDRERPPGTHGVTPRSVRAVDTGRRVLRPTCYSPTTL